MNRNAILTNGFHLVYFIGINEYKLDFLFN